MKRVILDTNAVVAGLLWGGNARKLFEYAFSGKFILYSSPTLINELLNTLRYKKLSQRVTSFATTPEVLTKEYEKLVSVIHPPGIPRTVMTDPDDDHVIACALAAKADLIVTGDKDLLALHPFRDIQILNPADAHQLLQKP